MFGISFSEILFILLIALIVLGPKQLTTVAQKIGTIIYSVKCYFYEIKNEFYTKSGLYEFKQVKDNLFNTYSDIKKSITLDHPMCNNDVPNLSGIEGHYLYQPELEFDRQPELFDYA